MDRARFELGCRQQRRAFDMRGREGEIVGSSVGTVDRKWHAKELLEIHIAGAKPGEMHFDGKLTLRRSLTLAWTP